LTRPQAKLGSEAVHDGPYGAKLDPEQVRACCSDEAWLQALMRVRHGAGEAMCPGCARRSRFTVVASQRALACVSCGHRSFPCTGTPLEKPQRALAEWLLGTRLIASTGGDIDTKDLQAAVGCTYKAAWRMEQELRPFLASEEGAAQVAQWLRAMELCLAAPPEPPKAASLPGRMKAAVAPAAPAEAASAPEPSWLARRVPSARARAYVLVFGGVIGATALTIGLASLLTDRSGRIDTAAPLPELAAPPSLTIAMLRSSIRLSPAVNAIVGDEASDAAETPYVEDRESYNTVIREGTAPGPRDPNEVLEFGPVKVRRHIVETIVRAARVTNADPVLLMAIADKESSFSTAVKAKTSSATGLYQFIEKTWLKVVKDFGPKHGLEKEAKAIVWEDDTLVVREEKERILDLRRDPYLSALLAGEMLNRDRMRIARRIGRDLTHGETYLAHFLGPDGAERFMATLVSTPKASAAELLPKPAAANKSIFFTKEGGTSKALTMAEVHEKFEAMMGKRLDRYRNVSRVATPMAFAPVEQPALVLRIGRPAK
jgi:hypothetical protein